MKQFFPRELSPAAKARLEKVKADLKAKLKSEAAASRPRPAELPDVSVPMPRATNPEAA